MFSGTSSSSLTGSGSNSAAGTNSSGRSLRNDLLVAADSVTTAMSTLVRELNSGMLPKQPKLIRSPQKCLFNLSILCACKSTVEFTYEQVLFNGRNCI